MIADERGVVLAMPEKVYVIITEDRHIDVQVEVYRDKEQAIKTAQENAKKYAEWGNNEIREEQIEGWLYFAYYSIESDNIRVEEKELL